MKKEDPAAVAHQEEVGARLRLVIDALGLSYAEAARIMGITPQRLNGWMGGDHPASLFHLARFCRLHPVTLDYLILGDARRIDRDLAERLGLVSAGR